MYIPSTTAHRIKIVLNIKHISMVKMLNELHYNPNLIQKSINSKYGLSASAIYEISKYLQVPSDFLLGLLDDETNAIIINKLLNEYAIHNEIEQNV